MERLGGRFAALHQLKRLNEHSRPVVQLEARFVNQIQSPRRPRWQSGEEFRLGRPARGPRRHLGRALEADSGGAWKWRQSEQLGR